MAKTRLNMDKRDVLHRLAAEGVRDTPLDPKIEKRKAKAQREYDKLFASCRDEAQKAINKHMSAGEEVILKKFDVLAHKLNQVFVHLDSRATFDVQSFSEVKYDRENLPAGVQSVLNMPWQDKGSYTHKRDDAADKERFLVPMRTEQIECPKRLVDLVAKLRSATNELEMAEGADADRRKIILQDFTGLISSCKTFEDVVAVWPEAKTVTDIICAQSTAVSLMSNEAIERIRANMATRGVE